jgi:outer membrane protein assembly factor BamB
MRIGLAFSCWLLAAAAAAAQTAPASSRPAAKPLTGGGDWSCFRGPRCGVSSWDNAPVKWDGRADKGIAWRTPLTMSCVSSPVVWANHVYLTEGNHQERAVLAFDAATGKQLWRKIVADGGGKQPLPSVSAANLAMPTPACDANGVYALFGTGDLASFAHDGTPRWKVFLQRPVIGYGFASSPVVSGGTVFVQFDLHENGQVLAVNAADGKTVWQRERSRGASWCSPIFAPGPSGSPLWLANANGSATAFDSKGDVVWDLDGVTGEVTPSPTWAQGRLYLVNVGSSLMCYDTGGEPKLAWQYKKALSDTASPVVVNGLLFMAASGVRLVCLDAKTGEELWVEKCPKAYASLVGSGDRVYCLGRDGMMLIVAVERKFREIGMNQLGDGADATPAMADGRMYIRSSRFLWCIDGAAGLK